MLPLRLLQLYLGKRLCLFVRSKKRVFFMGMGGRLRHTPPGADAQDKGGSRKQQPEKSKTHNMLARCGSF